MIKPTRTDQSAASEQRVSAARRRAHPSLALSRMAEIIILALTGYNKHLHSVFYNA